MEEELSSRSAPRRSLETPKRTERLHTTTNCQGCFGTSQFTRARLSEAGLATIIGAIAPAHVFDIIHLLKSLDSVRTSNIIYPIYPSIEDV